MKDRKVLFAFSPRSKSKTIWKIWLFSLLVLIIALPIINKFWSSQILSGGLLTLFMGILLIALALSAILGSKVYSFILFLEWKGIRYVGFLESGYASWDNIAKIVFVESIRKIFIFSKNRSSNFNVSVRLCSEKDISEIFRILEGRANLEVVGSLCEVEPPL